MSGRAERGRQRVRISGPAIHASWFWLLMFMAPYTAGAEPGFSGAAVFDPPEFVPGQTVTVTLHVDVDGRSWTPARLEPTGDGASARALTGDERNATGGRAAGMDAVEAGDADAVHLIRAVLERDGAGPVLRVRFVAGRPGQGYIPSLAIGGLLLPPVPFNAASAVQLAGDGEPLPFPQSAPRGLRLLLYLAGAVVLLLAVAGSFLLPIVPSLYGRVLDALRAARARKDFSDAMTTVLDLAATDVFQAWTLLCAALRVFVRSRTTVDISAMTASEVGSMDAAVLPGGVWTDLAHILGAADAVRFAGARDRDIAAAVMDAGRIAGRIDAASRGFHAPGTAGTRKAGGDGTALADAGQDGLEAPDGDGTGQNGRRAERVF